MNTTDMLDELFDEGEFEFADGGDDEESWVYVAASIRVVGKQGDGLPLSEELHSAEWTVEQEQEIVSGNYTGPNKTKAVTFIMLNLGALDVIDRDVAREFLERKIGDAKGS